MTWRENESQVIPFEIPSLPINEEYPLCSRDAHIMI